MPKEIVENAGLFAIFFPDKTLLKEDAAVLSLLLFRQTCGEVPRKRVKFLLNVDMETKPVFTAISSRDEALVSSSSAGRPPGSVPY